MSVAAIVGIIGGVLGILGVVIGALWRVASVGRDIGVMMARFEDHLGRMDGRVAKLESAEEGRIKSQIEKQAERSRTSSAGHVSFGMPAACPPTGSTTTSGSLRGRGRAPRFFLYVPEQAGVSLGRERRAARPPKSRPPTSLMPRRFLQMVPKTSS